MLGTKEFLKRLMLHPLLLRWSNQFLFRLLDKLLRDEHSAVLVVVRLESAGELGGVGVVVALRIAVQRDSVDGDA